MLYALATGGNRAGRKADLGSAGEAAGSELGQEQKPGAEIVGEKEFLRLGME